MSELIFGKYEILRRLAIGGMGEVFLARQTGVAGFERLAILKSLLPELAEQEGFVEQFLDEARVAATLNHPNIVGIYEVGLFEGVYYIAMEYIRGVNLARLLVASSKRQEPIPLPVAARIIHDAALGLHHAHCAVDVEGKPLGIVHRDVSPHNIMVRDDGVTKVVDFGIAKAANRSTRTATGMLKGKFAYMSPEQAAAEPLDARSDQFSLGVVLWELTCQRRLFGRGNEIQVLQRVAEAAVPPPSTVVPGYPSELEAVVMRMLARDRAARYPDLGAAVDDLRRYLDSVSAQASEKAVAACVASLAAEEIAGQTKDLTPSGKGFVLPLGGESAPSAPTAQSLSSAGGAPSGPPVGTVSVGDALVEEASSVTPGTGTARGLPPALSRRALPWAALAGAGGAVLLGVVALVVSTGLVGAPEDEAGSLVVQRLPSTSAEKAAPALPARVKAPATLVLTSKPTGAAVWAGATLLGTTPFSTRALAPGEVHRLRVEKKGYRSEEVEVRLSAGEERQLSVTLEKAPRARASRRRAGDAETGEKKAEAAPRGFGYFSVDTRPWTKVYVDGAPRGSTPIVRMRLSAGRHEIRLVNEGAGIDERRDIVIEKDKTLKKRWELGD